MRGTGFLRAAGRLLAAFAVSLAVAGCAITPTLAPVNARNFDFSRDTFAFANELDWVYVTDPRSGATTTSQRSPPPTYTQHCIVMARSVRQFFQFARFAPGAAKADDASYRKLIREVVSHNPSEAIADDARVVIPGYADLHSFSAARERLLKDEIGTWTGTYLQLGNWRMVFPFSRGHQMETAEELLGEVRVRRPPVVHLVRFPHITINHAVTVYDARETSRGFDFTVYDPNYPDAPQTLRFERDSRSFYYGPNKYFSGGELDVYEIYRGSVY